MGPGPRERFLTTQYNVYPSVDKHARAYTVGMHGKSQPVSSLSSLPFLFRPATASAYFRLTLKVYIFRGLDRLFRELP